MSHYMGSTLKTDLRLVVILMLAAMLGACATKTERPTAVSAPAKADIPSNSPLAKIHEGMGMKEVSDLIGAPTDTSSGITGKAFIPFYFGEDRAQTVAYYKGLGRITYAVANGSPRVRSVEYDPNESGYSR